MSSDPTRSSLVYETLGWLDVNKKRLAIGALLATAIGFGVAAYRWQAREKEIEASSALLKIKTPGMSRTVTNAPPASEFLKVSAKYAGTDAADRATLLAAGALFGENKYEEARQAFVQYVKDHPDGALTPEASFGIAVCLDALDKIQEAVAAYQDVITRHGASSVGPQAQLGLARLFEAQGKPDQALKVYEELAKPASQTSWAPQAATRKEQLLLRFPNLVKPPAPPALTNAPSPVIQPSPAIQPPPATPGK